MTLTLNVPPSVFTPLAEAARRAGATPEQFAIDVLTAAVGSDTPKTPTTPDPFDKWLGAISSNVPNWADEHDRYIGEAALRQNQGLGQ